MTTLTMENGTATVLVTRELILQGRTGPGGWKRAQLAILGVSWPPPPGWMDEAIGRRISTDQALRFLLLRG